MFWGLLFGLLFFIPVFGMAVGAGLGALFGHLEKSTIDKEFQQQVRDMVQPGTSALFLVLEKATPDKAVAAMSKFGGTVLKTSLSEEDTAKLQEALHGSAGERLAPLAPDGRARMRLSSGAAIYDLRGAPPAGSAPTAAPARRPSRAPACATTRPACGRSRWPAS